MKTRNGKTLFLRKTINTDWSIEDINIANKMLWAYGIIFMDKNRRPMRDKKDIAGAIPVYSGLLERSKKFKNGSRVIVVSNSNSVIARTYIAHIGTLTHFSEVHGYGMVDFGNHNIVKISLKDLRLVA